MIKFNKKCNVCKAVKGNSTLLNRIYNSSFYMKSGESLMAIAKDCATLFKYDNLKNHVKKHQFLNKEDFNARHLRQIANQAEKEIIKRTIESKQVWDTVINQGMEKLEAGEISLRTSDLLKAAKDKSDYEFKVKDQEMAFMEMVYHFTSGESNQEDSSKYDRRIIEGAAVTHYDATEGTTDDSGNGTERSGGVYYPPAWDAVAPGSNPLPTADY